MQQTSIYPQMDLKKTLSGNHLKGLWGLLEGFRHVYLLAVISLGIATMAQATTYLLLQYLVDEALLQQKATSPLYVFALGFIGLALVQGVFTFFSGRLAAHASEASILRLRNYLFDHIQRLSFSYHDKAKTGELVQRCSSDIDTIRRFYAEQAIGVGRIALLFTVNLIVLFSLNLKLGLLSVLSMPVVLLISIWFFRKIHNAYENHQEQEGLLSTVLQENLSGVRVVKAFARQSYESDKFEATNQEQYQRGKKLLKLHSYYWPIVETISGVQMLFIFFLGAIMAINGEITVGTYLAVAGLVIWIIWPMQNLGRLIVQTSMSLVSYGRVTEVLAVEQEKIEGGNLHPAQPIAGAIEFNQVSFAYEAEKAVLCDISFKVEPGQKIALLGPTGSGKSSQSLTCWPAFMTTTALFCWTILSLREYSKHVAPADRNC
jgi:ATP-binding cassette subfamily B protein